MEEFMNPFSEMYAFAGNSGDDTSNRSNDSPNPKKTLSDALSVESAYGTYNKPPKLMAIEEYNRWAKTFEEWLKAFAYQSWKNLKNGYASERQDCENLSEGEEVENYIAEQKCIALVHQSVRDDIISLIEYTNAKDLWEKLNKKCVGSAEIIKNKKKLLRKEFDLFGCLKGESVCKMIERFGHLKLELVRHGINYPQEELVDKLFDSLPEEMDWQYYALMLKNTIKAESLTVDLLIERLESHELEIKKTHKINHSSYQQNMELYYLKSMIPKNVSPRTAFSAENTNTSSKESPSSNSGFHGGFSANTPSQGSSSNSSSQQQSVPKNAFSCNIAIDLKNAQNFDEESAKQQMIFLASVLESYEGLVAGKIENPFRDDYYKRAIYHQNKSEPPRLKQVEDNKEKSRALAMIHDDEGYDWSELLPEEDAVGYAFVTKIIPFKDIRTEEEKLVNRRMKAQTRMNRIYNTYKEAKRAKRWDADRECYLDPQGNIAVNPDSISVDALTQQFAEEEEARQREWWGGGEEKQVEKDEKVKEAEQKPKSKNADDGIIDTSQELTAENLRKMAEKVLAAKELECKVCSTITYLSGKKIEELTSKVKSVENQILNRDKMLKASNDRSKELADKIENDKNDIERIRKENEKLILESRVLRVKEELINQQLDEIAKLKLQFEEAKIENERINLKLSSYNSASFVLQHIVPKPIGKTKAGEDVYCDGTGVGFHQVPPPVLNNFSKKQSGLVNDDIETNEIKLPESIDVTFSSSSSSDDSVQTEIIKGMAESVLDSDSTEDEECFLNNYIPKPKSKNNLNDEPGLLMYKMSGSDKLYSDFEFPLENVNVNKLKNVFKLVEIDLSEVDGLKQTKRQTNFEKDKAYYKKPVIPPRFSNNNQNKWSGGYQGGKNYQKRNVQNKKFAVKKIKTEPVKNSVSKNDKFYQRVASPQQTWKPKVVEKKDDSPKVSETEKSSSSTKKKYVPLKFYEKQKSTSEKKYVVKKNQSVDQPQKDEFFLFKEVEVETVESLKMNDKNFPPLYTKTTHLNFKLPESKEAWVASKSH
ncbi:uncharacterized protein LOC118490144 [Helianthus annuus]|uniref:uncharacterized protein LOC118490144 n=1 Tax=Helianthus annuus TaxID=4232 RepID=UPI001652F8B9|nr:uncharacterized protein LOC118490144 [Helianthus annuus]